MKLNFKQPNSKTILKCPYCGTDMEQEDCNFRFTGNFDDYYICPHCKASRIIEVRFSQVSKIIDSEFNSDEEKVTCYYVDTQKKLN